MRLIRTKDFSEMSQKVAELISAQITENKHSVLGLAAGGTVIKIYELLVKEYEKGNLDFSHIQTVNLDEYVGLEPTHPESYRYYMEKNLFEKTNINRENTYLPSGLARDLEEECHRYENLIKSLGGIDLQILGLGKNGHIGFNEPGPTFKKETHFVELKEETKCANSRFFESIEDVPKKAITMGIGSIMGAKKIVLCASGKGKAKILKEVLTGPITPAVPGSILQIHPDFTVVADEAAFAIF